MRRATSSWPRPGTSRTKGSSRSSRAWRRRSARPDGAPRRARPGSPRLRRGSPSSGRTRSSTTSASARRASRAPTSAASRPRSWTGSSAARPRPGSSRRSGRSAGSPTPSTRSPRSTRTPGRSASTWAPGRRTSAPASRSWRSRSRSSPPAMCAEDELARAKENLKGRIMLSMELTSNRMSRLGKSLITDSELLDLDRILAEIDAVDASSVAELTGALLRPRAPLRRGGGAEREARAQSGRAASAPSSSRPRRREGPSLRRRREGGLGARARSSWRQGTRCTRAGSGDQPKRDGHDAAIDFTRPDAVRRNVEGCLAGGHSVRRRHDRDGPGRPRLVRRARARGATSPASSRRTSPSGRS